MTEPVLSETSVRINSALDGLLKLHNAAVNQEIVLAELLSNAE
jgi:hypothetical protein